MVGHDESATGHGGKSQRWKKGQETIDQKTIDQKTTDHGKRKAESRKQKWGRRDLGTQGLRDSGTLGLRDH